MIIDVRAILEDVKKSSSRGQSKPKFSLQYQFENGYIEPNIVSETEDTKIEINPKDGDSYIVGLFIVTSDLSKALSTNGIFVKLPQIKASDILLFPSWEEAYLFATKLPKYISISDVEVRDGNNLHSMAICAAYQSKYGDNSFTCRKISAFNIN